MPLSSLKLLLKSKYFENNKLIEQWVSSVYDNHCRMNFYL